jgi:hypothetical protein
MLLAEDLLLLLTDDDTGRLVVRDPSPAGEEPLDRALTVAQRREDKKPRAVVGVFPRTSWPAASADHEAAVRRDLDRRAKETAEGSRGSRAVRQAIDAMTAAVTAAVTASTVAATSGG